MHWLPRDILSPNKKFWQKQEVLIDRTTSFFLQYSHITKIHSHPILIHQCLEQPFSIDTKGKNIRTTKLWRCTVTLSFLFWSFVTFLFIGECGDNKLYCPIVAQSKYIQQIWFFILWHPLCTEQTWCYTYLLTSWS